MPQTAAASQIISRCPTPGKVPKRAIPKPSNPSVAVPGDPATAPRKNALGQVFIPRGRASASRDRLEALDVRPPRIVDLANLG